MSAPAHNERIDTSGMSEQSGDVRVWEAPEVHEFKHRLRHGDSTVGWNGDEQLQLGYNVETGERAIFRVIHAEGIGTTMRQVYPLGRDEKLGPGILVWLRNHDSHTGYDMMVQLERIAMERAASAKAKHEEMTFETVDRVAHVFRKAGVV